MEPTVLEGFMLKAKSIKSKVLACGVIGAFILLTSFGTGWAQAAQTGKLKGKVFESDFETPVEDAVVKIENIVNGKDFKSEPSNDKGEYLIVNIEQGRYNVEVSAQSGKYKFDFEVYVKASETGELNIALEPDVIGAALARKVKPFPIWIPIGALLAGTGLIVFTSPDNNQATQIR